MNRFLYAEANPSTLVDPSGHCAQYDPDTGGCLSSQTLAKHYSTAWWKRHNAQTEAWSRAAVRRATARWSVWLRRYRARTAPEDYGSNQDEALAIRHRLQKAAAAQGRYDDAQASAAADERDSKAQSASAATARDSAQAVASTRGTKAADTDSFMTGFVGAVASDIVGTTQAAMCFMAPTCRGQAVISAGQGMVGAGQTLAADFGGSLSAVPGTAANAVRSEIGDLTAGGQRSGAAWGHLTFNVTVGLATTKGLGAFGEGAGAFAGEEVGVAESARAFTVGEKIAGQLGGRGWTEESIAEAVANPAETHPVWDYTTGAQQPATAYARTDGSYVVVNDATGHVVQVSDATNPNWKPVWNDPRFQR